MLLPTSKDKDLFLLVSISWSGSRTNYLAVDHQADLLQIIVARKSTSRVNHHPHLALRDKGSALLLYIHSGRIPRIATWFSYLLLYSSIASHRQKGVQIGEVFVAGENRVGTPLRRHQQLEGK